MSEVLVHMFASSIGVYHTIDTFTTREISRAL